ncbi:13681_t:CDS:1, partial [Funneliformis mosseae]
EYKYCKVIECTEEFTSKTCEHCRQINGKLGDFDAICVTLGLESL